MRVFFKFVFINGKMLLGVGKGRVDNYVFRD